MHQNLLDNKENAFLSKDLATIDRFAAEEVDINEFKVVTPDKEKSSSLFREFEFKSLAIEYAGAQDLSKKDYRFIPGVYKNMMTRLTQGEYIIENPIFRSLLNIKFPNPSYKQFQNV